jgi:integrase
MVEKRYLTDRYLKAIKPAPAGKRVIHWDTVVPGFGIRVSDKSNKNNVGTFVLDVRWPGSSNPAPRKVGFFAVVSPSAADDAAPVGCRMSLARGREIATEWRHDIARGIDPKQKAEDQRHAEEKRRASTFAAAVEKYAKEKLARLSSGPGVHADLKRHAAEAWGDRPLTDIKRSDVKDLNAKLDAEVGPAAARKQLSHLKTFFRWCESEELIEASPAVNVKPLSEKVEREHVRDDTEILAFWRACNRAGVFGESFKFMIATGARRTEVGSLRWDELDPEQRLWTLPSKRAKSKRTHTIPLSDLAMSILADRPRLGAYVFSTTDGDRPISGWSKAKARLDKLEAEEWRKIAVERGEEAPAEIEPWTLHDLRRTCATSLSKLGIDRVTISKVLNHSEGGVTKVYDRHSFDREKRRALDLWGQRLQSIIDGTPDNVVSIAARR